MNSILEKETYTPEDQIISIAKEMVGANAKFTDVTPTDKEYVKRLYMDDLGRGYVAYVVVINKRYNRVESEAVIYIDNSGCINEIKKLTFKTSDAGWGFVPPTDEVIDSFYDRLTGNNSKTLENVELVTNATNTSTSVVKSIKEALDAVNERIEK